MNRDNSPRDRQTSRLPSTAGSVLLSLFLVSAGCLSLQTDTGVRIPSAPAEIEGSYLVTLREKPLLDVGVRGFDQAQTMLGDGARVDSRTLELSYSRPGWRAWTLTLHHRSEGQRLLGATLECSGTDGGEVREACPRNNAERYSLILPDAAGAPGMLGLGPFLGETLEPGTGGSLDLWDPVDPGKLHWGAVANPDRDGCVELSLTLNNRTTKTPLPTLPYNRTLTACQGIPLPVEMSAGPIHWRLQDWGAADASLEAQGAAPTLPEPRPSTRDCSIDFPAHDNKTLPMRTYMSWAVENDRIVSEWAAAHPNGFALPSVGYAVTTGRGISSNSYVVAGDLFLYDPDEGSLLPLMMKEEHQRTLVVEESTFHQSEPYGSGDPATGLPPFDPMCPEDLVDLDALAQTLGDRLPPPATVNEAFLMPELMWGLQGFGPWTWPYQTEQRSDWTPVREIYQPSPWPYRAYVNYVPDDDGVALLDAAAMDPGGEWVRWVEREPASP